MKNFTFYSTDILKGMNTVEELTGSPFKTVLYKFEGIFWLAHDQGSIKILAELNEVLKRIIADIKDGNSFVLDQLRAKGKEA